MTKNAPDFVQAPETVHTGNSPKAGVFYEWRSSLRGGAVAMYIVPTGERQKNGKYICYMHDLEHGRNKKVTKVGMDDAWFRQWTRCEIVPGSVHALLTAAAAK